jgi:signal transduction histidine kinase
MAWVDMPRTEPHRFPRPLPLGLPLFVVLLLTLLLDRMLGLTSLAVVPQAGFTGGLVPGGGISLLADVVAVLVVLVVLLGVELSGRPAGRRATNATLVMAALAGLQVGSAAVSATTGVTESSDLYLARALLLAATTVAALHLLAALAEHRRATEELRRATATAAALATSGRDAIGALREDVADRVRDVLQEALGALQAGGEPGSGARLRALVDDVLRPLSHRLAAAPHPAAPVSHVVTAARWRDTLRTLLRAPVVPPWILALLAVGLTFLRSLVTDQDRVRDLSPAIPSDAEGVGVALTLDVLPLVVVLGELLLVLAVTRWGAGRLAMLVERRRGRRGPASAWLVVAFGIGAIAVLTVVGPALVDRVTGFAAGPVDPRTAVLAIVASFVPLLATTAGVSLVAAVTADRAALEADLAKQRTEAIRQAARVQAVLGHEQRRIARSLHADVQAAVNAAGLMLDRADRADAVTPELIDDAAARIATSVERFLAAGASTTPISARLEEVRALWAGVCTVEVELDDEVAARLDADPVTCELVVDLATEACANAVVHGDAGQVVVRVGVIGEEIELDVADDGTRRAAQGDTDPGAGGIAPGGLGTEVLRASCTSFTLDVGVRGSRLHAMLPLG